MTDMKRGVIEGFYGIPRTFEERKSMIEFLSDIGMNEYIYAPKDDPYHNVSRREDYPSDKLRELKELSDLSKEKDVDFVWAIHPGQNLIRFDDYDDEIKKIYDKYDKLHEVGINSFALCMDDIDIPLAYEDRHYHLKLVKDILNHISSYDNKNLLFVHPRYNEDRIDEKALEYYDLFRDLDNLKIMRTGANVVMPLKHSSNEKFYEISGQRPNIRFNRPVNDYKRSHIFMEIFEYYDSEDLNFDSFFINPMNQAELSKISIYQIEEFLKDPYNYNPKEAFKKALSYVDKKVADELLIISDSFFDSDIYHRQEDKKFLEDYEINKAYEDRNKEQMIRSIDQKIEAIDRYFLSYTNEKLYEEVKAFFNSLKDLLLALRYALNEDRENAKKFYEKSREYTVRIYREFTLDELEDRKVSTSVSLDKIYNEVMNS